MNLIYRVILAISLLAIFSGCLVSCKTDAATTAATEPEVTTTTTVSGYPAGLEAPRWLTDEEKEYVVNAAMGQSEAVALEKQYGLSRTDIDWLAIEWSSVYTETIPFAYEYTENETYRYPGCGYFPLVQLYFGEPARALLRYAISIETGEAAHSEQFTLKPLPTSPVSTPPPDVLLTMACPYTIVDEELGVTIDDPTRTTALRSIVAEEADCFEELAATALQAAIDLYVEHGKDRTSVVLMPCPGIHVFLAQASFAADGRGAEGMTGSAPANPGYWVVRAADRTMTGQEMAIAELWFTHMEEFPSKNKLSSLFYDKDALCEFIAAELDIPVEEIDYPRSYFIKNQQNYIVGENFIEWTLALRG